MKSPPISPESEAEMTFVYKTVQAFSKYSDYINHKISSPIQNNKIYEGYLIDKKYFDFWKVFSDYETLKNYISQNSYQNSRNMIYKYRKTNKYKGYQSDAHQVFFYSYEDFFEAVNMDNKSYILIDNNFWKLICEDNLLNERGGVKFSLGGGNIIFHFGEFDYIQVVTNDYIIDPSKKMILSGSDINRNEYEIEREIRKLLLLYSYEQEIKNKCNNLKYKDTNFHECFLISKEWIENYKKYYHYKEICDLIEKNNLKRLLSSGYAEAKKNIPLIIKNIVIKKELKNFPQELKDNNTFLVERVEEKISNHKINFSFWRNFEIINEDLKNLFSFSDINQYSFNDSSSSSCLFAGGKVVLNLSDDECNPGEFIIEVGSINNEDMTYDDEYIFRYESKEAFNEDVSYLINDFNRYQKEFLNFDNNLECDLKNKEGRIYGKGLKIPIYY